MDSDDEITHNPYMLKCNKAIFIYYCTLAKTTKNMIFDELEEPYEFHNHIEKELDSNNKILVYKTEINNNELEIVTQYLDLLYNNDEKNTVGTTLIITRRLEIYKNEINRLFRRMGKNTNYEEKCVIIHYDFIHKLKNLKYQCIIIDMGYYLFEKLAKNNSKSDLKVYNTILPKLLKNAKKIIYIDSELPNIHVDYLKKYSNCENFNITYKKFNDSEYYYTEKNTNLDDDDSNEDRGIIVRRGDKFDYKKEIRNCLDNGEYICIITNDLSMTDIYKNKSYKKYNPFRLNKINKKEFYKTNESINNFLDENQNIKMVICDETIFLENDINDNIFDSFFIIGNSYNVNVRELVDSICSIKNKSCKKHVYYKQDYIIVNSNFQNYTKNYINKNGQFMDKPNSLEILNKIYHNDYLLSIQRAYGKELLFQALISCGFKIKYVHWEEYD